MVKQLFEIGQKITPINNKKWEYASGKLRSIKNPKFGDVFTVRMYDPVYTDYLSLEEIDKNYWYHQEGFAPVLGDEELEMMLKEEPEYAAV